MYALAISANSDLILKADWCIIYFYFYSIVGQTKALQVQLPVYRNHHALFLSGYRQQLRAQQSFYRPESQNNHGSMKIVSWNTRRVGRKDLNVNCKNIHKRILLF